MEALKSEGIKCQSIECRAKAVESFKRKCEKRDANGAPKYRAPLDEITDLSGVRIILFTLRDVDRTSNFLEKHFDVRERKDIGQERIDQGNFGYQSVHYLIAFSKGRLELPDFQVYANFVCEVQVRTVLQHAWAEIEHDVQYKSEADLPKSLKKKFLSLAGLLEIADREFQAIQDEDARLKSSVLADLQDELTRDAVSETQNIATKGPSDGQNVNQNVRALLLQGLFHEAIKIYDEKIAAEPRSYTLYIGRAKARFLSGDTTGAKEDIEVALDLNPDAHVARNLKVKIIEGDVRAIPLTNDVALARSKTHAGNAALRDGMGVAAYEFYSDAQKAGASVPFSITNKAMACLVAGDYEGAKILLDSFRVIYGTPAAINIQALYTLLSCLTDAVDWEARIADLQKSVEEKGDFEMQLSPLPIVKEGLEKTVIDAEHRRRIAETFGALG